MGYTDVLSLLGGLAMFLFGMSVMSQALEKRAGKQLKTILSRLTSSKLNGFLLGLGVTAIIQSSSATTVMVVGFVNSGLMKLSQSIYIIMGANVGSAVTNWILSLTGISGSAWYINILKPSVFTPVIAIFATAVYMFSHNQKKKDTATVFLGFSVLMFGMEAMSSSVEPLSSMPGFSEILIKFSNPFLGVIVGALLTALIQSSAASVGILQALSMTGVVSYSTALPIIMGQNIGTCITALLSSMGTSRDAKRAAFIHLYFNVIGTVIWLSVFYLANSIFQFKFVNEVANPVGIVVIHTAFKILSTAVLMPFGKGLEKLACMTIRDGKEKEDEIKLDERLFITPSVALSHARAALLEMARVSVNILIQSLGLLKTYDEKTAAEVVAGENLADKYEDKLGTYLVKLSTHDMDEESGRDLAKYLHMIGDFERISDHAVNILDSAEEIKDKHIEFSPDARKELGTISDAVTKILRLSLESLETGNLELASQVEPLEQVIDYLNKSIKARHIDRLTHGECTIEHGFVLNDVLNNLERVSDHCSNIAVCLIEIAHNSFDTHEYLHDVKEGKGDFIDMYERYKEEYQLLPPTAQPQEN